MDLLCTAESHSTTPYPQVLQDMSVLQRATRILQKYILQYLRNTKYDSSATKYLSIPATSTSTAAARQILIPALHRTTKPHSSFIPYYKVLFHCTSPVLLQTSKALVQQKPVLQRTTLNRKILDAFHSALQSLRTTLVLPTESDRSISPSQRTTTQCPKVTLQYCKV